jgi:hypothetical protein
MRRFGLVENCGIFAFLDFVILGTSRCGDALRAVLFALP